jgi:murein DD-endopeptidase MepM/ murein hydrolase activator NlpD
MPIFPLKNKDDAYKTVIPRRFGSPRPNNAPKPTRKHAGCDLTASAGTEVFAVDDGLVIEATNKGFLEAKDSVGNPFNVGVVAIWHGDIYDGDDFIARYGEVDSVSVTVGQTVTKGQVIAKVAKQGVDGTQLHFEMYSATASGDLTQLGNLPYKRRGDLIDPTSKLDSWKVK